MKLLTILLFLVADIYALDISSQSQAVNVAGKQRMLSYRMFKDHLMVSMDNNYKNPDGDMKKSMDSFNSALDALGVFSKDAKVQTLIKEARKEFDSVKSMLAITITKENAIESLDKTISLRTVSHKITIALESMNKKDKDGIVNKSGRLRAISQVIASVYLLKVMGVESPKIDKTMKRVMGVFRETLDTLKVSPLRDDIVDKKLKKLESIYLFFDVMNDAKSFVPTIVNKKSNKMLKYSDELTSIFVKKLK